MQFIRGLTVNLLESELPKPAASVLISDTNSVEDDRRESDKILKLGKIQTARDR